VESREFSWRFLVMCMKRDMVQVITVLSINMYQIDRFLMMKILKKSSIMNFRQ